MAVFGLTLIIFYLIFRRIDLISLQATLLKAHRPYLLLALLLVAFIPLFSSLKWQLMLKIIGYQISWSESLNLILSAFPVSAITPARSGDLVRAYYLKNKIPLTKTMGGILTERALDVAILTTFSLIGALVFKNQLIILITGSILLMIALFFVLLHKIKLTQRKWPEKINHFLEASRALAKQPAQSALLLLYTALHWTLPILEAKILFLALGTNIPLSYLAAAFPLALFIGLLPITVAGMGTRDSAIIYLFSSFSQPATSLGVGLLYSFFGYWLFSLIGLFFMRRTISNMNNLP